MSTPISQLGLTRNTKNLQALRELRLWHWFEYLRNDRLEGVWAEKAAKGRVFLVQRNRQKYRNTATFHIRAVQALNEFFPINDTAELDAKKGIL